MAMDKSYSTAAEAVRDIPSGATIAVGGFGLCGNPMVLIKALKDSGIDDLSIVSNNCGVDDWGLGILLAAQRIRKMTSSYLGENSEFERQFFSGELEVELNPQGTLAERMRAGGSGIGGFFTRTGIGTQVEFGGLPQRYDRGGSVIQESLPKFTREFLVHGQPQRFLLEDGIVTDYSIVHAAVGDRHGNLIFNKSARNFNPLAAMSGQICIAQVEKLVEPGELDADAIHLPGVFVHRMLEVGPDIEKRVERLVTRGEG